MGRGCKVEGVSRKGRSAHRSSNTASKWQSTGFKPGKWQPRALTEDNVINNASRHVNRLPLRAKPQQHLCCWEFISNTGAPLKRRAKAETVSLRAIIYGTLRSSERQKVWCGQKISFWKKHFRLSFQSPFSFLFCANTTKIIFTKNPLANVVKKHIRLPSQPPFSFLFCAKTEKNCADKKSACKWREETRQTYFQSRRGNS
jgi:hypothetical protein